MRKEYRHLRTVFGGAENLTGFELRWVEVNFGPSQQNHFMGGKIITEVTGGIQKRLEADQQLGIVRLSRKSGQRSQGGQLDVSDEIALQIVQLQQVVGVVRIGRHQMVVDHPDTGEDVVLLGYDLIPVRPVGLLDIDSDNTSPGSIEIGLEIEPGTDVVDEMVTGVGFIQ